MRFEDILFRGQYHRKHRHRLRANLYRSLCRIVFHCEISLDSDIDSSVRFMHSGFCVVIHPDAKVGGVLQYNILSQ